MITTRHLVMLALAQIGVITIGSLAAGMTLKVHSSYRLRSHSIELLTGLATYGWLAFVLPLAWISIALWVMQRSESDLANRQAVAAGFLLLAFLVLMVGYGVGREWMWLGQQL